MGGTEKPGELPAPTELALQPMLSEQDRAGAGERISFPMKISKSSAMVDLLNLIPFVLILFTSKAKILCSYQEKSIMNATQKW